MKLTFSVEKIETEFIKPFQSATSPPIMLDVDELDQDNDQGGSITLAIGKDGKYFLASDRDYSGDGLPVVYANQAGLPGEREPVEMVGSYPFPTIIGLVESAKAAGQDRITITVGKD